jgi:hypothetical protein
MNRSWPEDFYETERRERVRRMNNERLIRQVRQQRTKLLRRAMLCFALAALAAWWLLAGLP